MPQINRCCFVSSVSQLTVHEYTAETEHNVTMEENQLTRFWPFWVHAGFVVPALILNAVFCSTVERSATSWLEPRVVTSVRGHTVHIECFMITDGTEGMVVTLHRKTKLCYKLIGNSSLWTNRCTERISFLWNNETQTLSFTIKQLMINDSDTYTCKLQKIIPPPSVFVMERNISLKVTVPPVVSVSCEVQDNVSVLVCSSERFYPEEIEQFWLRDQQPITNDTRHRNVTLNSDSSFTLTSRLSLSGPVLCEGALYVCWVNHSALNTPTTANITVCENKQGDMEWRYIAPLIAGITVLLLLPVLILTIYLLCMANFKELLHRPSLDSVDERSIPPPDYAERALELCIYSTLGEHHPVQCPM
ncbi:uncharacterized protein LOC136746750 [Amia ocellicauda]|uniref:uncharacterized protein LOC136746750 n=1 Tax=Amia ocellicauda TaxID=2972642 RepID=UPI003463F075